MVKYYATNLRHHIFNLLISNDEIKK